MCTSVCVQTDPLCVCVCVCMCVECICVSFIVCVFLCLLPGEDQDQFLTKRGKEREAGPLFLLPFKGLFDG